MAKFKYDLRYRDDEGTEVKYPESFDSKKGAQNALRRLNYGISDEPYEPRIYWVRVVVVEASDFIIQKKRKGFERDFHTFDIYECTEQSRFETCPWAGNGSLIWFDDKYELWHTDKFGYRLGEEGFFLVDINARRK